MEKKLFNIADKKKFYLHKNDINPLLVFVFLQLSYLLQVNKIARRDNIYNNLK